MKKSKVLLLIIFIIAIIPPLALLILRDQPISGDELDFNQIAIGLLEGRGFHSSVNVDGIGPLPNSRHPLYPIFIAIIYLFTNNSVAAVKVVQVLIQGATCVTIFFIAKRLFKNRLISFGAGIIWALYPVPILSSTYLMSETLFTFLLTTSALSILRSYESPGFKNGLLAGLSLGLTALAKSVIFAFIPIFFLWLVLSPNKSRVSGLKNFAIIMLFMVLTVLPWAMRNYIVLGQFLPFSTSSGLSFYRFNNEKTLENIYTPQRSGYVFTEDQLKKISHLPEPEIDKYLYKLGWQFVKSHPKDFIKIRLNELRNFWHLWPASPQRFAEYHRQMKEIPGYRIFLGYFLERLKDPYLLYFCKILYHLPYNILFLGMFISLFTSFKRHKEEWNKSLLLFLLIATINVVYIFHCGSDRYRMPIDPYVFILGAHGVILIYERLIRILRLSAL